MKNGPMLSIVSAFLFGLSPVLSKFVIGETGPILLAGLLYLGSGLGLMGLIVASRQKPLTELKNLSSIHRIKLLGSVLFGGILAPLCFAYGLNLASAFEVSVLLNLETVTTTVFAWLVFKEHVGNKVWFGKVLIILGGLIITISPQNGMALSAPGLLLVLACVFWGIDNNLTRDVDELSPTVLAAIKGFSAGGFNTLLALAIGQTSVKLQSVLATLAIGAASYGLSLVLFIYALRAIGSSRTSTYFATGPFFGMLFSVLLLGESPPLYHWVSAVVMFGGLWILYRENHVHEHIHEPISHKHAHVHDEHHQHEHSGTEGPEPHDHLHSHSRVIHSHTHLPDIHHRHFH